jgi:hypothetical protein
VGDGGRLSTFLQPTSYPHLCQPSTYHTNDEWRVTMDTRTEKSPAKLTCVGARACLNYLWICAFCFFLGFD